MKIAIYHNNNEQTLAVTKQLTTLLKQHHLVIDNDHPDLVITVGGDGTLLGAFHHYEHCVDQISFVGIHTGHLGFYTDWRGYEVATLVDKIATMQPQLVAYPLLKGVITYADGSPNDEFLALNESSLKRLSETLRIDVYISGEFFESFRGDGLCVSTPTGSTAYNKSVGGAVLHPKLETLQMAEVASINNLVYRTLSAPIVIAPDDWIDLRPEVADDYVITVDEFANNNRPLQQIHYEIAKERIHFARYRTHRFWDRVEGAFIGSKEHNNEI
ncbi:MAG: NAD kinase [Candidatus Paralactobacillus gallistercoris]|uniref:NAD kinase n=1 Tax=Candidatus Paralactobacillus gallistercoris TaxID=2838724 RepID=A0A948X153_9LACO|nr:NAD kinase [Candidatus Paralactobacillus gallistercoris]